MVSTQHSELHEDFLKNPSLVDDLLKFLSEMEKSNKMEGAKDKDKGKAPVDISAGVTETSFIVQQRIQINSFARFRSTGRKTSLHTSSNRKTFMCQIDVSPELRRRARQERYYTANVYRRLGNLEYRKNSFDKAIEYYTSGLSHIVDTPILYVNRSLCYIKKRNYKRALIDLEYVLNHLDGCCLRAWLYKAATLKRLNNDVGFDECVYNARKFNRNGSDYINYFLDRMRTDF